MSEADGGFSVARKSESTGRAYSLPKQTYRLGGFHFSCPKRACVGHFVDAKTKTGFEGRATERSLKMLGDPVLKTGSDPR